MAKKAVTYLFITLGLCLLYISTSRIAMQYISDLRDNDKWWGSNQRRHGDLASISDLDFVNRFYSPETVQLKKSVYRGNRNIALLIHGDSYLWHSVNDSLFAGLCAYRFTGWHSPCQYNLDTSKKNVLVIEVSERLLRDYYEDTAIFNELKVAALAKDTITSTGSFRFGSLFDGSIKDLFNKNINQNLQFNLFNYNFLRVVPGSKAAINYYLFRRAAGGVVISDGGKYLLFTETISTTGKGSSYAPVTDSEISVIVGSINSIVQHYKRSGFEEVLFSIIPNTATMIQPKGYNGLIPRIQNDARLKVKTIDVYSAFKKDPERYFLHGDTHWNNEGRQLWLDMVNEELIKVARE